MTDARRPAWQWIGAMVGVLAQTVVTAWVTVALLADALDYKHRSQELGGFGGAGFFEGMGSVLITALAFVVGLVVVVLVVALLLSVRRGGTRLAGFIVALVVQAPLLFVALGSLDNGVGAEEVTTLAGAALVLLAVASPPTWRWCRQARTSRL